MKKLLLIILVISLSLSALVLSIEFNSYNKGYYMKSYEKYKIIEITNKSMEELSEITDNLISYLKGHGREELLEPYFNEREVLHMVDVQDLFDISRLIKYICIFLSVIIIYYILKRKEHILLGKTLIYGLFVNHILFGILSILAIIDFNKYFNYFHFIFFDNDLWLLDPKTDLMIQMLPERFFSGIALNTVLSFFIILSILQIVGYWFIKKGNDKYGNNDRESKRIFFGKK